MKKHKFTASDKIQEALEILKEASKDGREGISQALEGLYETAEEAKLEARRRALQAASSVERSIRENPWPFIGGAALGGFIIGFLRGKKS